MLHHSRYTHSFSQKIELRDAASTTHTYAARSRTTGCSACGILQPDPREPDEAQFHCKHPAPHIRSSLLLVQNWFCTNFKRLRELGSPQHPAFQQSAEMRRMVLPACDYLLLMCIVVGGRAHLSTALYSATVNS